ncbi:MAG TPA: glycosyltransferase family 4 protein [Ignavibacteria bacterium]
MKENDVVKDSISEVVNELVDSKIEKKKIVILISAFSKFEGASRVAEHQASELSERKNLVEIFTFGSDIISKDFKVNIINPFISLKNPFLEKVYRGTFPINLIKHYYLIKQLKHFDVIILHHATFVTLAYLCRKIYGIKVIVYNHHVAGEVPIFSFTPTGISELVYGKFIWSIYWKIIRYFDIVISVSKYSRSKLKEKKGVDSFVIYNKIDNSRFRKGLDENRIRSLYNINNEPLILYVGRIIPSKGVHLLITSFKNVKTKITNAKLIIVGKHYDKDYSKKLMKLSDESVFFAEQVSDENLPFYYAACDVYATCSLQEGFNLTIVEAQACGKPIVAFDIGPHKEVLVQGYLISEFDLKAFSEKMLEILTQKREIHNNTYNLNSDESGDKY